MLSHEGWSGDSATGHRGLPAKEKQDFHTYFVGKQALWVHNANCGGKALIKKVSKTGLDELEIIAYREGKKVLYDNLTPHHIPSQNFMNKLISNPRYQTDAAFKAAVDAYNPDNALCIMMEETIRGTGNSRHGKTLTYGNGSKNPNYLAMNPLEALALDIENLRDIYRSESLYTIEVSQIIDNLERKIKQQYPNIFKF